MPRSGRFAADEGKQEMFAGNHCNHRFGTMLVLVMAMAWGGVPARADDTDSLRPYSGNPFYWQYKGKPVLLLGGTDQDNLFNHPDLEPDGLQAHLDLLVAVGGNYIRNTMSHRDAGNVFAYVRNGEGLFDLDEFNHEYWDRFESLLKMADERDIIVQIEVWEPWDCFRSGGPGVSGSQVGWEWNPFNPANNVTYSAEEAGLPTRVEYPPTERPSDHPFFQTVPKLQDNKLVRSYQEAYVSRVLEIALAYPNVLYCLSNEIGERLEWSDYWADFIHAKAAAVGRAAYVGDMRRNPDIKAHDHLHLYDSPTRYAFVDISQNNVQGGEMHWNALQFARERVRAPGKGPRPLHNTKIYRADDRALQNFWRNVFGGCAVVRFHRPYPASAMGGWGLTPTAQATLRSARRLTGEFNVFASEPRNDLLSERTANEAYCLAAPGRQYAVYFPDGGQVTLDVSAARGSLQVRWLDISRSAWQDPQTVDGSRTLELRTPGKGHWAVLVLAR
jgi:hypothetical protein